MVTSSMPAPSECDDPCLELANTQKKCATLVTAGAFKITKEGLQISFAGLAATYSPAS